jgi:hypothetical protein
VYQLTFDPIGSLPVFSSSIEQLFFAHRIDPMCILVPTVSSVKIKQNITIN